MKEESGKVLSEKIRIDIINVHKSKERCYTKREEKIARWCKLLLAENISELKSTLGDDLMEEQAKETLMEEVNKYSTDEEVVALYSAYSREELERNTVLEDERKEAREVGLKEGFKQGIKDGIEQGINQGIIKGKKEEKEKIILNMLYENLDISIISKVTGLPEKEISIIKEKYN